MAWQRTIAFGYRMCQGEIICDPTEAEAVKDIFARYLRGESLHHIAEAMESQGIRYHERTEQWNKNMIKRVLENSHYHGDEQYPSIISKEKYHAAQEQKKDNNVYVPCAISGNIRSKVVCGRCGAKLNRVRKIRKISKWECENLDCSRIINISDEQLNAVISSLMDVLVHTPCALTARIPIQPTQSSSAQRIANELTNAFNRGTESVEYLRTLVLACAAERYNELPDCSIQYKTDRLRQRLETGERSEAIWQELFNTAVRSIRITDSNNIVLELVNGQLIRKEEDI